MNCVTLKLVFVPLNRDGEDEEQNFLGCWDKEAP